MDPINPMMGTAALPDATLAEQAAEQENFRNQSGPSPIPLLPPQPTNLQEALDPSLAAQQIINQQTQSQATNSFPTSPEALQQQNFQQVNGQQATLPPSVEQLNAGRQSVPATSQTQNPMANQPGFLEGLKKVQEDYLRTFSSQQAVAEKAGAIGKEIEDKKVAFYNNQETAANTAAATIKDAFDKSSERVEQQMQERQQALDNYKEMLTPEKLNDAFRPRGLFEGRTTGQSILGAIAIGLGGSGAAVQGGGATNQALALINRQLDKEAEARQTAFKMGLTGQQNLADEATKTATMARQQGQDVATNALQQKALQLEAIQAKVEQMVAPYKGQLAQQNAKALIAGLQQQKDQAQMVFQQAQMQRELLQNLKGLSFEDYDRLAPAVKTMLPEPYVKQMEAIRERNVPGYGPAANKELAAEFNKARPMLENGINATQNLIDFTKNYNMYSISQRDTADTMIKALMGPLREPLGMRVLTAPDKELLEEMIGNPNSLLKLSSQKKARLDAVLNIFKEELSARAIAAGLTPKNGTQVEQQQNQQFGITKPNLNKKAF